MQHASGSRHVNVERWSRGASALHCIDARAKLGALLVFLTAIATTSERTPGIYAGYFVLILVAITMGRLPIPAMLGRAALVLPFSAVFALVTWWAGDPAGALVLVAKSFLSVLAAITLAASTPWVRLLDALASLHVPRPLLLVIQFLYRYLFVVTDQAARMRLAASSRQGAGNGWTRSFHAAAGAVGVLFARSWMRADGVYRAMLARGFTGHFAALAVTPFHRRDAVFLGVSAALAAAVRVVL
ncbi:MAG TPA: energy-coupling factor transporter transmembrane component T [Bryobacteraceae bacterium]|nr:energy-coupling factor transporter transmembrane component T [Bryobacteraceae bacterium]